MAEAAALSDHRTDTLPWRPHPGPQSLLIAVEKVPDVFYGGARGGGKTDGLLGAWLFHAARYGRAARGLIFRRTMPELDDLRDRALRLFSGTGARFNRQRSIWEFPNGATLRLRYLEREADAARYQGHSYTYVACDEVSHYPTPDAIDRLYSCLRSPEGIPCQFRLAGNPGGRGHAWLKERYIDPAPPFTVFRPPGHPLSRLYIPARLADNPTLLRNDPGYVQRLQASGPDWLVRAWLEGDWHVVPTGGIFTDLWNERVHVVSPFPVPEDWPIYRAFDWGSSRPFALLWYARIPYPVDSPFPMARDTIVVLAEYYGCSAPNVGLRLPATTVARQAARIEAELPWGKRIQAGPADPAIFTAVDPGQSSVADEMARLGIAFFPAPRVHRVQGWELLRQRLKAAMQSPPEDPALFIFASCRHTIRTFPTLPCDPRRPDDVDTEAEDHIADTLRYIVSSAIISYKVGKLSGY